MATREVKTKAERKYFYRSPARWCERRVEVAAKVQTRGIRGEGERRDWQVTGTSERDATRHTEAFQISSQKLSSANTCIRNSRVT